VTRFIRLFLVLCCGLVFAVPQLVHPQTSTVEEHPLAPPDLSSPGATIETFLDEVRSGVARYRDGDIPQLRQHIERAYETYDTEFPPTESGFLQGALTSLQLFEVLIRVELPPREEIPGAEEVAETELAAWTIPNTELTLARRETDDGRFIGYRFDQATMDRLPTFYLQIKDYPPQPEFLQYAGLLERFQNRPGLGAPAFFVGAISELPPAAFTNVLGEALWKWATLVVALLIVAAIFYLGYRLAGLVEGGSEGKPERAVWARPLMLTFVIGGFAFLQYVAVDIIQLTGPQLATASALIAILMHGAVIWLLFLITQRVADAVIRIRDMGVQQLDAQLVRLVSKLIGVLLGLLAIVNLADQLGIPIAPMLAGLGVGGLAVALAVRPTLENVVAGFVLFADKPVKVGEFCMFGDKLGTVESIGLRSVKIRGLDRTVISLPNAEFSMMEITNFSRRDSNLFHSTLGLRYETTSDQLRLVLARLRELLIRHPMVSMDPARVRFAGYGDFSLNVELFAFVNTRDWNEFLAVQEDLNLRIKDIVEGCGTGFAFPSQTLYIERGHGLVPEEIEKAETLVRRWREDNRLPFPEHETGFRFELANTLDYPPKGSPGNRNERPIQQAAE
jgi:MscS family membrane protein